MSRFCAFSPVFSPVLFARERFLRLSSRNKPRLCLFSAQAGKQSPHYSKCANRVNSETPNKTTMKIISPACSLSEARYFENLNVAIPQRHSAIPAMCPMALAFVLSVPLFIRKCLSEQLARTRVAGGEIEVPEKRLQSRCPFILNDLAVRRRVFGFGVASAAENRRLLFGKFGFDACRCVALCLTADKSLCHFGKLSRREIAARQKIFAHIQLHYGVADIRKL